MLDCGCTRRQAEEIAGLHDRCFSRFEITDIEFLNWKKSEFEE